MICSVLRSKDTNEIEQVLAPNGDDSILFSDINKLVPEKENSLRLWAQTYTKTFLSWFQNGKKDVNGEALLDGELFTNEKGEQKSLYNRGSFLSKNNDISIEKKPAELLLPYGKEGTPYQFEIKRNNSPIGDVHVVEDNGILSVYDTQLKEKGNNNGTYAYLKIAEYAKNNNLTFTSDVLEDVSDAAKALWNRFVQTGQAQLEGNRYVFTGDVNKVTDNIYAEVPDSLVNYNLKSVEILNSPKADEIFRKGDKNSWSIEKILQELQIPKEQQELIKGFNTRNREQILTSLLANYSYTVEINTAKEKPIQNNSTNQFNFNGFAYRQGFSSGQNAQTKIFDKVKINNINAQPWDADFLTDEEYTITEEEYKKAKKEAGLDEGQPSQHYSNLTVPGGTNYTENEILTPNITPSIKGHAQFATDKGIGWTRTDDRVDQIDDYFIIQELQKSGLLKIEC